MEGTIERKLKAEIEGFEMNEFVSMIQERQDQLMSEVFDLLISLADFEAFRDLMHAYRQEVDLSNHDGMGSNIAGPESSSEPVIKSSGSDVRVVKGGGLRVSVQALKFHSEEQEDGEVRPDLDGFALTISSPQGTKAKMF